MRENGFIPPNHTFPSSHPTQGCPPHHPWLSTTLPEVTRVFTHYDGEGANFSPLPVSVFYK